MKRTELEYCRYLGDTVLDQRRVFYIYLGHSPNAGSYRYGDLDTAAVNGRLDIVKYFRLRAALQERE